jgi:cellobiose phosphorylase
VAGGLDCEYVKETGDDALFDGGGARSPTRARPRVYEHLKRALDFSAEQVGQPASARACAPTGTIA